MDENLFFLLKELLTKNSIKVNNEELKLQLFGHPSYPSLHSLTGVLDHFNIPNLAIEIPKTEENIALLPDYFIAHIENNGSDNFALISKKADAIQITREGKKSELVPIDSFIDLWTGIVLVIETDENIKTDITSIFSKVLLVSIPVVLIICFLFLSQNPYESFHFAFSMIGLMICIFILQHEIGTSSQVLNKICTGVSDKVSCDDVMQSKGSNLFGFVKLSDLGIIYFLTSVLSSLLFVMSKNNFTPLFVISLTALPFTIYSIYYQFQIVKKWCLLCLGVILVLWIQSALATANINSISEIISEPNSYLLFAFAAYLTTALWLFIAPKIRLKPEYFKLKVQFNKFKRNFEIFNNLLSRSQAINTTITNSNEIVFGTKNSELEIVIITNPLCGFCKNAHKLIHIVLDQETEVKIIVRFNVSQNTKAIDNKIASKLVEIYHINGEKICLTAMNEAYSSRDSATWLNKWGESENEYYSQILMEEKKWCTNNNIPFTPEILLNGKSYPKEYDFEELQYFLEDLNEFEVSTQTELITD
ncbi:thioredoxin domain-containing protein [Labilibaculum sp. A4]|uniref:vitamin K epoxide reductase family protein n=1 Tax=Labilibaculum euxinus TaxID=2686357 RepID=UPI000F61F9D1|nr:vitamin K epoxide reductase family protein [Labilibaculum euxinus]MDQ1772501.1 vitamin K epoxide reductase family protein [Labilibaculum euxinus]MWN78214.1 thioredoxin domain-containing protein [Labilibaculum euxinus]